MSRSIWKQLCLALPLAIVAAEWNGTHRVWAQSRETNSAVTAVSSTDDELLFDTQLISQSSTCSITSPLPACTNTAVSPPQQFPSPDAVFSPSPATDFLPAGQGALTAQNSVAASLMPGGYLDPAAPVTMSIART